MENSPSLGNHYSLVYEPAIKKAGLRPVRADDDIFATGKIMDQVWEGINAAQSSGSGTDVKKSERAL